MNRTGILKYPIDYRPVGAVLLTIGMSLLPFLVSMPLWLLIPYLVVCYYMRSFTPFAQHNHAHLSVFRSKFLNHCYDALLTQCTGYPSALWELHHNRGHHRNFLTPVNDVAAITWRSTGKRMSRWMYALKGNLTIHLDSIRIGSQERREGRKSLLFKLTGEVIVQFAIAAALFYWNPNMALACFIVPSFFAAWFIWWESYPHHLEVPSTSIYDGSVTITDRFYNFQTFNIGFHTAHHEKPTLHWSLLPSRTQAIREQIPAMCIHETYYRSARRQANESLRKAAEQVEQHHKLAAVD